MPLVSANSGVFHYEIDDFTDPWTKPDTIWIQHGTGRSGRFWRHWVPTLARNYSVIRRDQRGHGLSPDPGPDSEWSMETLLCDMLGFLDALGLDSVHYIGESMGAVLGVRFAQRWPDRLKSLTLCSMPLDLRPPHNQVLTFPEFGNSSEAKRAIGADGWARAMVDRRVISGGKTPTHTQWVIQEISKTPIEVLVGIGLPLYSPEASWDKTAELLGSLTTPTLVLAPTKSPLTPLDDQVWIRDMIPNARIAIIDGPTHEVYVDSANECLDAVGAFLASISV